MGEEKKEEEQDEQEKGKEQKRERERRRERGEGMLESQKPLTSTEEDPEKEAIGKALMLGEIEGGRRRGRQRMRWLDGITDSDWVVRWQTVFLPWVPAGRVKVPFREDLF